MLKNLFDFQHYAKKINKHHSVGAAKIIWAMWQLQKLTVSAVFEDRNLPQVVQVAIRSLASIVLLVSAFL